MALHQLKRYDEAITHYESALSLKPDINWVLGDLLHAKMQICNWSDFDLYLENISNKVLANKKVTNPFPLLAMMDDPALQKKASEIYIKDKYPFNSVLGPISKHSKKQKIRIGYFSADFRDHPVATLTVELFELHDKDRFENIAFSFGLNDESAMRLRLSRAFNQFIDISNMSDLDIAKLARDLKIDIAVDLGGFTAASRPGIFSFRAAPIQVSYLGYLGTMGAHYIDYIIADQTLIPPQLQKYYSEKIVYLPDSYQVNDRKRTISDKKFTRQELGLPENGFVFCCFNNNYKFTPSTFDSWMRILGAIKGSVLWLFQDNSWVVDNLRNEADKHGVDVKRLVFAERMPLPMHLARHSLADLFLDTFPYNAHTTASDALWAGLPVLTLMGQSFASRVAASLLNAIGLPELVVNTAEEYEALAIDLALNPKKLADAKLKLATNRLTSPLFNTPLFTKNIESAYIQMYEQYKAGLELEHISIT
jgi:predicted O-linked N-acetylglucosamine transferase (SPINDLY family)